MFPSYPPICFPGRRWLLVSASLILFAGLALSTAGAQAPPLDAAVLAKVKAATVFLQVKLHDDRTIQGSGFFTDEPGLIATNAHVLDMLGPESRQPLRIDVTLLDSTGKTRTLTGKVVGVDHTSDLGLIRVEDKQLPTPLPVGSTMGLRETETVYVFGFPFGKNLGNEITVGKATVSSLRKTPAGTIHRVQLEGGLHPGNSGGPVVDGKGNVIGVAVGGVRNSPVGFAIPGEHVLPFLNGRISGSIVGTPYKDGAGLMLPVTLELVDPLGRLKMVDFELWAGNPGSPRLSGTTEPAALPGDSPKKRYGMKYDKSPTVSLDVPAPPLADPKQVYWLRPVVTNGLGETRWLAATASPAWPPVERTPVTLKYRPPVGKRMAEMVSIGSFRIRDREGNEKSFSLDCRTSFTEEFTGAAPKVFPVQLSYDRLRLTRKLDDKRLPGDEELGKMLADIVFVTARIEMDRDGSLATSKAELANVPAGSREALTDISDQILQSLELLSVPLPNNQLAALDRWKCQRSLRLASGIIAVPAQADIEYKYLGVQQRDGKSFALIAMVAKVKGGRGEERKAGGSVTGTALVSLESGEVVQSIATVKADVDIVLARVPAKAMGTLSLSIKWASPAAEKR
ncbi:hypothetical protein AYO44_07450 [Planctomycetaceae bacterium SCGC AG-212-F19]|nr:hypothetical protein AYO44_07450 [Planctomycetaceae bacterium SCGC AG-212-F19]